MKILVNRTALDRAIANAAAGGLMREEERRAMFAKQGRGGGGGGGGGGTASGGRARSTIRQGTATGATTKVVVPKPGNPQDKADALYYWPGRLPPYWYPPDMYRPLPVYPGIPTYPEKPFPIRPGYPEKPISKNPPKAAPPPQRITLPIVGPYPRYPLNPERPVYYATSGTAKKTPTYTTKDYTGTSVAKVIKVYEDARKNPPTGGRVMAVKPKK